MYALTSALWAWMATICIGAEVFPWLFLLAYTLTRLAMRVPK